MKKISLKRIIFLIYLISYPLVIPLKDKSIRVKCYFKMDINRPIMIA